MKEYFYRVQDDNNKEVLDTSTSGSYGECTYVEITEKLEKISQNNKAWSTKKSDRGRNTFALQALHNPAADEIHEEMAQMRTELGLMLKYVIEDDVKVNAANYLAKLPLPVYDYYCEEDSYAVNENAGAFDLIPKDPIRRISAKFKEIKVTTMEVTTERALCSRWKPQPRQ